MKLICQLICNGTTLEKYQLSEEMFIYNGVLYPIEDATLKLLNLIGFTLEWDQDKCFEHDIVNGFYVHVSTNKGFKEYFWDDNLPENFNAFICEMKKYFGR